MKAKRVKGVAVALVGLLTMTMLSGCDKGPSKEEIQAENESLLMSIVDNESKISELESMIDSLRGGDGSPTAISEVSDGSGMKTFNSIGGKILFPEQLEYTGASQAPNTSKLNLSDRVSLVPSDNWVIQLNGTTTKYSHPNGIYGTIKISVITGGTVPKTETVETEMLKPFTDAIPHTSINNSKIYIEDKWRGMASEMTLLNNEKPAVVKCGLVGYSDIAVTYSFYYEGDKDNTKTEIINNLLKSMKFGELQLRIE